MNTTGKLFRLTTFGESHGIAIGGVIDGCPAGLEIDTIAIEKALARRRPGQSIYTTPRKEEDTVSFLSGLYKNQTTGAPIAFVIENKDVREKDYEPLSKIFRPGHADYPYLSKYGIRDPRGGGRSSARETAIRVVAGAIAQQILSKLEIDCLAYTSRIGSISLPQTTSSWTKEQIESSPVRCPDEETSKKMLTEITAVINEHDSVGGIINCQITGVPAGWGAPIYNKLHADLGAAMLSINAAKGFEIGDGFDLASMRGSEANDGMFMDEKGKIGFFSNHSGGIIGGISTGQDIYFRVAFKPTPTIGKEQKTIDETGEPVALKAIGRHDPCVVIRAVPIVEAMAWLTLADAYLQSQISRL